MKLLNFIVAFIMFFSELVVAEIIKIYFTTDDSYSIEVAKKGVGETIE